MKLTIDLTLEEIDCVVNAVGRDRDRVLDDAFRESGIEPDGKTRLITDDETARTPIHQSVLKKLETALCRRRHKLGLWRNEDIEDTTVHFVDDDAGWIRVRCTDEALMQLERDSVRDNVGVTCKACLSAPDPDVTPP